MPRGKISKPEAEHLSKSLLMTLIYAKINDFNCKLMFSSKLLNLPQTFLSDLFNIKIEKKMIASVTSLQLPNKNISSKKKKILDTVLTSDVTPFLDENKLHLLTPLFKSTKHFKICYKFVVNYNVAKDIVNKILPYVSKSRDIIVEANPGLGLITLCLINSEVPKITIFDKSEIKSIAINQLVQHHQGRFRIINVNLFKFPGLEIINLIENSIKLSSPTKVIGVITNNTFLINLMYTYIINELWDNIHYLEFYLVISSTVWKTIFTSTSNDSRYLYHCLFNFIFTFEALGKYPSDAFLPVASNDKDSLTLVRIRANSGLIKNVNKDDLKSYFFFLEILSRNKQTYIIPMLDKASKAFKRLQVFPHSESLDFFKVNYFPSLSKFIYRKFVPGCGPYLISKGVSMSNIIRDFSPSDSVILFNFFKKCKGYEIFKAFNVNSHENAPLEEETK